MAEELIDDGGNSSYFQVDFLVNMFRLIIDRFVQSRFLQLKQLYKDLTCLHTTRFKTIAKKSFEDEALEGIIKLFP